jgi:hypothetical protein
VGCGVMVLDVLLEDCLYMGYGRGWFFLNVIDNLFVVFFPFEMRFPGYYLWLFTFDIEDDGSVIGCDVAERR